MESELATILVLDEDIDSRMLLKRVLQRMGHQVFAFRSSKEASEWAASRIPDLGIINVRQRHNQEFPIFGWLKKLNQDVKVMVITDAFPAKTSDKWFADEYLIKPLDIDQVEEKVRKLLVPKRPEIYKS